MERMELPSQEVLIFTKQIRHWILSDKVISGKRQFIFREDTSLRQNSSQTQKS